MSLESDPINTDINSSITLPGGLSLVCSHQPSFTKILRDVKRQEHSLFNAIASIVHDALFVEQVIGSLPEYPAFANLRCGLWYLPQHHHHSPSTNLRDTCYFKSTDGHTGNWGFSTTRLNINVLKSAIQHGGAFIIDATKRGKRFPVSFE